MEADLTGKGVNGVVLFILFICRVLPSRPSGSSHYQKLADIEKSLCESGILSTTSSVSFFSQNLPRDYVEDDHLPFERLGILVVHLIRTPFPAVWHTDRDDESALDNDNNNRFDTDLLQLSTRLL
jgi:hypothetical protein